MTQVEHPATEWLRARLSRGPSDAQAVADDAVAVEITPEELLAARDALCVVQDGVTWSLPPAPPSDSGRKYDPRRLVLDSLVDPGIAPGATPVRADLVPSKKRTPKEAVEKAKNNLRRRAPRYAQYLDELARKASEDAVPCPTCGRGTPRSEEVRLRAVVAALDRSGVVAPRGEGDEAPSGPVIVFPPGTTMAVVVKTPPPVPELRLTRGDELGA